MSPIEKDPAMDSRGRCEAFYRKWEQDPNWCDKCNRSVYNIERYIALTTKCPVLSKYPETSFRDIFALEDIWKNVEGRVIQLEEENNGQPLSISDMRKTVIECCTKVQHSDFEPYLYNVWNVTALDQRFGTYGYPGQTPGQYVQNVLYYFTNENDLIVDPFSGGGTTIDVCKSMNRRCLGYDISPSRVDIKQNDITNGYPLEAKDCDLIYLDPPYFDAMYDTKFWEGKEDYLKFLETLAQHSFQTVKENGVVALLIMDLEMGKFRGCWSVYALKIFLESGFYPDRHISAPLSTEQFSAFDVERAKKERFLLGRNRDLYIFRKVIEDV